MVAERSARVELLFQNKDAATNQRYFEALFRNKEAIEGAFGSPLDWQPLQGRKSCRIKKTYTTGGYRNEDVWEAVWEELAVAMAKLESAFAPYLKEL